MSSSTAKNLEAIHHAIVQHNGNCGSPLLAIFMNPFEVERLDFDEILGVPVKADDEMSTGRFRLACSGQHDDGDPVDAVAEKREVLA